MNCINCDAGLFAPPDLPRVFYDPPQPHFIVLTLWQYVGVVTVAVLILHAYGAPRRLLLAVAIVAFLLMDFVVYL